MKRTNIIRDALTGSVIRPNQEVILVRHIVLYARKLGYLISDYRLVFIAFSLFSLSVVSAIPQYNNIDNENNQCCNDDLNISAVGNVNGNGVVRQMAYWNGTNSIKGNRNFTYDNEVLYMGSKSFQEQILQIDKQGWYWGNYGSDYIKCFSELQGFGINVTCYTPNVNPNYWNWKVIQVLYKNINGSLVNISADWFKGKVNWSDVQNSPLGSTYNVSYHGSLNNASYLTTYNLSYDVKISFNNTNLAYINRTQQFNGTQTFDGRIHIRNSSLSEPTNELRLYSHLDTWATNALYITTSQSGRNLWFFDDVAGIYPYSYRFRSSGGGVSIYAPSAGESLQIQNGVAVWGIFANGNDEFVMAGVLGDAGSKYFWKGDYSPTESLNQTGNDFRIADGGTFSGVTMSVTGIQNSSNNQTGDLMRLRRFQNDTRVRFDILGNMISSSNITIINMVNGSILMSPNLTMSFSGNPTASSVCSSGSMMYNDTNLFICNSTGRYRKVALTAI